MHIYIDESGGFIPLEGRNDRVSAVVAVVVPSRVERRFAKGFAALCRALGQDEPKGSGLAEAEIAKFGRYITRFDTIAEAVVTEMGDLSETDIRQFQEEQAKIIEGSSANAPRFNPVEEERKLAELTRRLSPQNFVQGYLTIALVDKLIRIALAYYAQRDARELSEFRWIVDAKNPERQSGVEEFWTNLVLPALAVKSKRDPIGFIPWGKYEHLSPFEASQAEYTDPSMDTVIDTQKMLADLRCESSSLHRGLQAADMFASAVTRSFNGRLGSDGWRDFGRLLVHRNRESEIPEALQFVTLRASPSQPERIRKVHPRGCALEMWRRHSKPMVPHWHRHHLGSKQ